MGLRHDSRPRNAWGVLRSPWNLNPSPYVTRFADLTKLPGWATCSRLASSLSMGLQGLNVTTFATVFAYYAQFPPHAHGLSVCPSVRPSVRPSVSQRTRESVSECLRQ